jgi:nucleoid-associated protein YgaU
MPNDAKLGLVVGVALVISVGVVFFRADAAAQSAGAIEPAAMASEQSAKATAPEKLAEEEHRGIPAQPTARHDIKAPGRRHKVEEGDTLPSLAERYLGDGDRANEIFEANRGVLHSADDLPVGTDLAIPESDKTSATSQDDANP